MVLHHRVPPSAPARTKGPAARSSSIASPTNPFCRYYAEILRTEGLNAFTVTDIAIVTRRCSPRYDVAILGEIGR